LIQDLFIITNSLRETLHSIGKELGVAFAEQEIARLLAESVSDLVSAKSYCFFRSPVLTVSGIVDEYEPETVWIQVEGNDTGTRAFQSYLEDRRLLRSDKQPLL
jgi:hypothetical protein